MTLGEIKVEALRMMFVDTVTDYESEDLEELLDDDSCRDYIVNMPGAINRCFSDLESRSIVPEKRLVLTQAEGEIYGGRARYELPLLAPDFMKLERVIREDENGGYDGSVEYMREGNSIVLKGLSEGERYVMIYRPRIDRIRAYTENNTNIALPDNIAALIPYFIKSELFRADEPDEAQEARNWYDASLSELITDEEGVQRRVKSVYSPPEV